MPNDSAFAIQTQALSKHYGRNGEIKALQTLNLEIRQGELFGFLGPNGAGKRQRSERYSASSTPRVAQRACLALMS
jgi:ABC-type branched-subunit amino acid transport system ATPase component